jgi:Skp family chaperone for outer membrane proteins
MQKPYKFLVRWNALGELQGAHVVFQENGIVGSAESVAIGEQQGFPLEEILGEVATTSLKTIDDLKQAHQDEIATLSESNNAAIQQLQDAHQTELNTLKQEHEAGLSQLRQSYEQQIEQLQQELDSLKNPAVNWSQFRLAMMNDAAYDRVEEFLSDSKEGTRLLIKLTTVVSMENPNIAVLKTVWNAAISQLPTEIAPTTEEISGWNTIAASAKIPFQFDANGKIVTT